MTEETPIHAQSQEQPVRLAEVKPAGIARGGVKKIFRLRTEEDAKLKDLIKYAHLVGYIKKPKF